MQWYYAVNGKQNGPVEENALFDLARNGQIKPNDLVWNSTMGSQWAKASTVPGLVDGQPGTVAGAPPVTQEWTPAASYVSRTYNAELMDQARQCLSGNWGLGVGVTVVSGLIVGIAGVIPVAGGIVSLIIGGPIALGTVMIFLALARAEEPPFSMMFDGFKRFGTALGAYLLMALFTILWTLLLIVPGIIAALSYAMTYYILRDDPSVGPTEAIDRSKQMMSGNKWKYFCLQWRFFGWELLCLLTLGIGFLWLGPYIATTNARFYEDLRAGQQG